MAYATAFSICFIATLVLELFFRPSPMVFFKRRKQALLVTTLLIASLFLLSLLFTQRPYFSAGLTILGMVVVLVVSNTKFMTLREPLVFSDFFLYLQAVKHPRLYLPFLGLIPLVTLVALVLLITFTGFYFEQANYQLLSWSTPIVGVLLVACVKFLQWLSRQVVIDGNVKTDTQSFGVLATLCCYGAQASRQRKTLAESLAEASPYKSVKGKSKADHSPLGLADIVVVQSESFFDARVLTSNIKPSILAEYDKCLSSSVRHGRLQVPAWGANTMRTEFAFLAAIEPEKLGLAQFYPYQQLLDIALPSVVSELKLQGYWCVCIHPNAASFFMRDEFFRQLGFDEFVDADEFIDAKREGPYISDAAVTEKIEDILQQCGQPCFIFAITMENHGPLHLESVSKDEWRAYYDQQPQVELTDLTVYLRHLKNADAMIKRQLDFYRNRERETVFAFYGDHVPAVSNVFEALDYDDPRSNYFIWTSWQKGGQQASQLSVESLGPTVLRVAESLSK